MLAHDSTGPPENKAHRHANPPRSDRVAGKHAPSHRGLSARSGFANLRALRPVVAASPCRLIHSDQHRGGVWPTRSERVTTFPLDRRRIAARAANTPRSHPHAWIPLEA